MMPQRSCSLWTKFHECAEEFVQRQDNEQKGVDEDPISSGRA